MTSTFFDIPAPPTNPHTNPREFLLHLFNVAVNRALPLANTAAHLPIPPEVTGPRAGRTLVIGAGKAADAMAHAVEALWDAHAKAHNREGAPLSGLVVTRYGHTSEREPGWPTRIEVVEASHPVPDSAGHQAAARMLALTQGLTEHDLVLCLISGGGSALLTLPCDGLDLTAKQAINRALLASGAGIAEMNGVRKHLSQIKGGRLAKACAPARVVTLAISDVPGDEFSVIASGPTVPDASTCADALATLQRYAIEIPAAVRDQLELGALETPKPGASCFNGHSQHLIAAPMQSLQAAAQAARDAGVRAYVLSDEIEGESREVGKVHAAIARSTAARHGPFEPPCVIISGGETTVTLRPRQPGAAKGRGGRAGEFCMGLAGALQAVPNVWAIAADTDGIDGIEDNAGAIVTPDTLARARAAGIALADCQDRNNACGFFEPLGDTVVTGPTHTNVNDFRAIWVLGEVDSQKS